MPGPFLVSRLRSQNDPWTAQAISTPCDVMSHGVSFYAHVKHRCYTSHIMSNNNERYDSVFWVEVERIKLNPFQPRKTFDAAALASLDESIKSYGVLQPLTVTRKEIGKHGEGIAVEYELIAGERRLRASKLAGLRGGPVVIRTGEDSDRMKLEIAIINK